MKLSVFELAYLGSQAKDTAHMGRDKILRFANAQFMTDATDTQWMRLLDVSPNLDWPLAWLLWLAEANNAKKEKQLEANRRLLLAQPVFFSLQRDSFALESVVTLLTDEYQTITDELNHHFNQDGIHFLPSMTQQYWFLQVPAVWELNTHMLQSALRQNIQTFMPQGPDANKLRQVSNQVQMLLHEHPVNQQRLKHGQVEMNSVWFSGNSLLGQTTALRHSQTIALIGESALTQAISVAYKMPIYADLDGALASRNKHAVMLLDHAEKAPWDTLFSAVQNRKIQRLDTYSPLGTGTLKASLSPFDCWKFWRQPFSLAREIE